MHKKEEMKALWGEGDCDKLEGRKEILAHSREAEWTGEEGAKLSVAPGPAEC